MNTETWYEAAIWNPTDFKPIEITGYTDKTVTLVNGSRRQRATDNRIIARSQSHLKSLLIAYFDREARKYEGWAQQKRKYIEQVKAMSEDSK